jgi:predicted amidohydrolase YtcJ
MTRTIFTGGPVRTMAGPASERVEVVVVDGGRIVAVGPRGLEAAHPGATVVDLAGRTLVPGFIDAHAHLSIAALHPRWADLTAVRDVEGLHAALRAQAAAEPDVEWVRGVGWSDLEHGFTPTRDDLDALGLDRPVCVAHYSYHQAVVSSAGLDALGIGASTADPDGGEIGRGPDGRPNGLLVERAFSAAHAASIAPYRDPDRWADHVERAARALLADGVTCVHDAACPPSAEALYAAMARDRRLPVAVVTMPHAEALLSPLDRSRLDGPTTGEGGHRLRVGPVKLFADGGTLPAIDGHVHGHRISIGCVFAGLADEVDEVVARGFRVAVHAIGNAGAQSALDAFTAAARRHGDDDHRFRLEHATLLGAEQPRRMASLGVVGVVQPGFVRHMGGAVDGFELDELTWMPFADLVAAGVTIAGSSDSPCAFSEPLLTSALGVTRLTSKGTIASPEQSVPYETWLEAYTAGAAYAGGQEAERGRIAAGLVADLVVLDGSLDAAHPPTVAETWVDGERVHVAVPA